MNADQEQLPYPELTDRVIGVFYEVYNERRIFTPDQMRVYPRSSAAKLHV